MRFFKMQIYLIIYNKNFSSNELFEEFETIMLAGGKSTRLKILYKINFS